METNKEKGFDIATECENLLYQMNKMQGEMCNTIRQIKQDRNSPKENDDKKLFDELHELREFDELHELQEAEKNLIIKRLENLRDFINKLDDTNVLNNTIIDVENYIKRNV